MNNLSLLRYYLTASFKYLTFKRGCNFLKNQVSYYLSIVLKKPIVWGYPSFITFETSSICNLSCPECLCGMGKLERSKKFPDFEVYEQLLNELHTKAIFIQLYFQGEPLMNGEIVSYLKLAKKLNMATEISTNGNLNSEKLISEILNNKPLRIIVSLDGISQKVYEEYRRKGDVNSVKQFVELVSAIKRKTRRYLPFVELQTVVSKQNEHELAEIYNFAKKAKANRQANKTMQVYSQTGFDKKISSIQKYSRYKKDSKGNFKIKKKGKKSCKRLWTTLVVTSDSKVAACCFDKNAEHLGIEITNNSINEVWNSVELNYLRNNILSGNLPNMCSECSFI